MAPAKSPREIVIAAVRAGRFGAPASGELDRVTAEGADMPLDALGFDSLGWMEFCISVELDSGLELTPSLVASMTSLGEVEAWIAARGRK